MIGKTNVKVKPKEKVVVNYVEYIQSMGTQYIDTGIKLTNNSRVEVDCVYTTTQTSITSIFGSQYYTNDAYVDVFTLGNSTSSSYNLQGKYYKNTQVYSVSSSYYSTRRTYGIDKNIVNWGDGTTHVFDNITFKSTYNCYLFGLNYNGSASNLSKLKLYGARIYENDVLVRDFKPARDDVGIYCLYDKVSKTYFYNKGSGSFTGGASI